MSPLFNPSPVGAISVSNTLFSSGTVRITGGPGVTVGSDVSGASISGQALSLIASDNTFTSGNFRISGGANITVQSDASGAVISAGAGGGAAFSLIASDKTVTSGTFRISGGPGVTVNSDASGAVLHAGFDGSFWDNAVPQNSQQGLTLSTVSTALAGGRMIIQPMSPANEQFPFDISATQANLNFSGGSTSTSVMSGAFSSSFLLGFYTRANATQLSLLNSCSAAITGAANNANSSLFNGARYLSFHSSQFSSPPNFDGGNRYFFAQIIRTSGSMYAGTAVLQQYGMHIGNSIQRSGQLGVAASSNATYNAWYPFMGVHSLTTHTAFPVSIAHSDISKASAYANFIPHLMLLNSGYTIA